MRNALESGVPVVVKIGSSSIARPEGGLDPDAVRNVVDQVVGVIERGNPAVLVTSGAIAAGFPTMGHTRRPTQIADLQVAAAIGQTRLMERYTNLFAERDIAVGQVLLTRDVLGNRHQYLNARSAIERML
ncbi:MAG: glutamate 5-kinase, partial [Acidimicrobiia bacterium]|nr:glutamate 5-kinase [Acidimicrobiia bacterium]